MDIKEDLKSHESFGMIKISRFNSNGTEYFGSDLVHNGGISITISNAEYQTKYYGDRYYPKKQLIRLEMSSNQFVDMITSGMNTQGVPCTIKRYSGNEVPQISHIVDKKEQFSNEMKDTHKEYKDKINNILSILEESSKSSKGTIGKRKANEIKHELEVLKSHITSNTNFVMDCFNEAMEKSVTEAKHTISNYIDTKVTSLGLEGLRNELSISIDRDDNNDVAKLD